MKIIRRCLAVPVFAAALLSANVAGAQPAAQVAQAAQAAGTSLGFEAVGVTAAPGPDACPRIRGASRIITPNSCGPPPPPPRTVECDFPYSSPPALDRTAVYTDGQVRCDGRASINLLVTLEMKPPGGTWREIARDRDIVSSDHAFVTASTACANGRNTYRGVAQATVNGDYLGKAISAERVFTC
jgi:hypothetical protein